MILLLLIGIAVLYLFLKDTVENAAELLGLRVFLLFLSIVVIVIAYVVSQQANAFLHVLGRLP